jgi:serine/threonine protein kinase
LIRNFSTSSDITISCSIEILGPSCFDSCESLSSISFESPSRLSRVESRAFANSDVRVLLPSTLVFLAHDAHSDLSRLSLSDPDFCSVFDRWRRVRESGAAVDFRPILRQRPDHPCFKKSVFDIAELEEESVLLEADQSSSRLYRRRGDGSLIVVKSISLSDSISKSQTESEIANLVSLRHPLIASPIGFAESAAPRRLKIARPYAAGGSLAEALSDAPPWWTPTAKAKAIAGIALGLRFAHSLGLLHGGLKASNVLFDAERRIQIADFSPIRLQTGATEPFAGEGWGPAADVCAFASFLSDIAVGCPGAQPGPAPPIPAFVSAIIEGAQSPSPTARRSFATILQSLRANGFAILAGVDSAEVCAFVESVESSEQGAKRE